MVTHTVSVPLQILAELGSKDIINPDTDTLLKSLGKTSTLSEAAMTDRISPKLKDW